MMQSTTSFLESLYRQRLRLNPRDTWAAAWLAQHLRSSGQAAKALVLTAPLKTSHCPFLQTARAAAFCDLERWELAQQCIDLAFVCGGQEQTWMVQSRIRSARKEEGAVLEERSLVYAETESAMLLSNPPSGPLRAPEGEV